MKEGNINLFSREAEQIILGSLLYDNNTLKIANTSCLSSEDFYFEGHKIIYNIINDLIKNGIVADVNSVAEKLKAQDYLIKIGEVSVLNGMISTVASPSNINYYINTIKEFTLKRELQKLILKASESLENGEMTEFTTSLEEMKSTVLGIKSVEELYVNAATIKNRKKLKVLVQVLKK